MTGIKDSDSVATSTTSSQSSDFAEPSNTKLSPSEFGTGIRGLSNLGNTCFFNSVMQSLCESVQLRRHLLQLGTPAIASKPHLPEGTMLRALRDFFRSIWSASSVKAIVTPSGMLGAVVRANPSLGGGRQQDAHELFRCVVNAVRDEALKFEKEERAQTLQDEVSGWNSEQVEQWFRSIGLEQPDEYLANVASSGDKWTGADLIFMIKNWKATESNALRARLGMKSAAEGKLFVRAMTAIKDGVRVNQSVAEPLTLVDELFGGQLCSTVRCLACHQVSVRRDPFFDLSLAITPPITESTRPRLTPTRAPSAGAGKSTLTVYQYLRAAVVEVQDESRQESRCRCGTGLGVSN
jgi:ubiquitin C-terminal hydrolase